MARKRARRRVRRSAQATAWKVGDGNGSCLFGLDTIDDSCARVRKPSWNTKGGPHEPHTSPGPPSGVNNRSEEHTSELQSLMRTSYAVFCLNKKLSDTPQQ